jgi:hypothetical protein
MRGLGVLSAAAMLVPGAAAANPGHGSHGRQDAAHGHGSHGRQDAVHGHHGHHVRKPVNYVFKGTLVSVDTTANTAVVHVVRGNHWARSFKGQDVTFDLANTRVITAAPLAAGDPVLVQARLARDVSTLTQPLAARRLIDLAAPASGSDDTSTDTPGDVVTPPAP